METNGNWKYYTSRMEQREIQHKLATKGYSKSLVVLVEKKYEVYLRISPGRIQFTQVTTELITPFYPVVNLPPEQVQRSSNTTMNCI